MLDKPLLIFDLPGVVEPALLSSMQAATGRKPRVVNESRFFQAEPRKYGNDYFAGGCNFAEMTDRYRVVAVKRSLTDFFVRYLASPHLEGVERPDWATNDDVFIHWLFDCQESYIKKIVGLWLSREKMPVSRKVCTVPLSYFGPWPGGQVLNILPCPPYKQPALAQVYRDALVKIAQKTL